MPAIRYRFRVTLSAPEFAAPIVGHGYSKFAAFEDAYLQIDPHTDADFLLLMFKVQRISAGQFPAVRTLGTKTLTLELALD